MTISLAPEPVLHFQSVTITNSILTAWIVSAVLLIIALLLRKRLSRLPGRLQSAVEMIVDWLYGTMVDIIGRKDVARALFPYLATVFVFIVASNWSGLIPGFGSIGFTGELHGKVEFIPLFRAPTSDLNMVAALAVLTVGYIQYLGLRYAGPKVYLSKFFNFSNPIMFYVGLIELVSEFTRILSFSFRLFGNIFAGEVLVGTILYLTQTLLPFFPFLPLPFYSLELFVGVVQAFVFCFLTIVFTAIAVAGHGEGSHTQREADEERPVPTPIALPTNS